MTFKYGTALVLLMCLSAHGAFAADKKETAYERVMRTKTIRCGYGGIWPPYFDMNPNTKTLSGLNKELSDRVAQILGLKIEYQEVSFANKVTDLQMGKIDAMCGDGPWILTSITAQDYTKPFYYAGVFLYGRATETRFKNLSDFDKEDVKFVGIDGDLGVELAQLNFSHAKLVSLPSITDPRQMLMDIATNKSDVTITDPAAAESFMKAQPSKIKLLFEKPVAIYGAGFGVAKGEQELLNTLNAAVEAARNTGAIEPLLDKYDPSGKLFKRVTPEYDAVRK